MYILLGVRTRPIWYPESWETAKMPFCVLGNSWSLIIMNQRPSSHLKPPTAGDSNIGAHIQIWMWSPRNISKHIQTLHESDANMCPHSPPNMCWRPLGCYVFFSSEVIPNHNSWQTKKCSHTHNFFRYLQPIQKDVPSGNLT